ncbi:hypothetical protein PABG_01526 [Paracoccidioides brasiliensis Pb03]|nr:hypothetical protein PABG_01526 [Paracoccidioides brasiliensis Pb03]
MASSLPNGCSSASGVTSPYLTIIKSTATRPATSATANTTTAAAAATTPIRSPAALSSNSICDACYRRNSRCAMNESANKCFLCEFYLQDCTFMYSAQVQQAEQAQDQSQAQVQSHLGKRKLPDEFVAGTGDEDRGGLKRPILEQPLSPMSAAAMPDSLFHKHPNPHFAASSAAATSNFTSDDYSFQTSQYIGMTTELEPLLLNYLTLDRNNESPLATSRVRKFADDGTFMRMFDGSRQESHTISVEAIDNLVSPFGPILVDKFFQHAHPAFPVLIENSFRHLYQTRRNLSPVLLAAVYFVALKWLDPATIASFELSGAAVQTLRTPDATRLETMATRLFNESVGQPHISTLQAGLLLSQRSTLNNPELIAQLVTAGFDLGLHQDCSSWNTSAWEKGLRKRLAWALYVQDKWCALVHGRPSHIFASNWTVQELTPEDFADAFPIRSSSSSSSSDNNNNNDYINYQDTSAVGSGALLFCRFVTLTAILSEILNTFYTLQATSEFASAGSQRTRIILERAKPIQIRLKEWFVQLPNELKMEHHQHQLCYYPQSESTSSTCISTNTDNPDPANANFNGGLHLAYFATEITLHRTIIRSLGPDSADPYLSHICRSAAKTRLISAMDFVNRLRPAHLRSFWPSASRTNFALISSFGILLRATAETWEEEEFYRMRLGEYRWTLSVSCKDAEFLVGAIDGLDVGMCLLRNVPPKRALEEVVVVDEGGWVGGGGSAVPQKRMDRVNTLTNVTGDIVTIVEDDERLDGDSEQEDSVEMYEEQVEEGVMEEREGEDENSVSSDQYSEDVCPQRQWPNPNQAASTGAGATRRGSWRNRRQYHNGGHGAASNRGHRSGATTSGNSPMLQSSGESAGQSTSNSNQNRPRNRNRSTNVGFNVNDARSGSLSSVVSGLASPAASMEGARESSGRRRMGIQR